MKISRIALALVLIVGFFTLAPVSSVFADEPAAEAAPAEPERPRDLWDRMLAVEILGGLHTPYGVVGGALVITPMRNIAIDIGGGASIDGGRVAGGLRLVLPFENAALGVRVGLAGGPLTWETSTPGALDQVLGGLPQRTTQRKWEFAGFLDLGLSLEFRFDAGIYTRAFFGVEHALTHADSCTETVGETSSVCSTGGSQPLRAYVGLAIGYAFDI